MIKIHSLYQIRSFSCLHFVDYELSDVFHMLEIFFLYKSFTIIFVVVSVIIISLSFYPSCFSYYYFIIIILFIFILNITYLPKYVAQSTFEPKRARHLEREKKNLPCDVSLIYKWERRQNANYSYSY